MLKAELQRAYGNLKKLHDNSVRHATEIITNLERKIAGLQSIIDGPEQIRDPQMLELCVERTEYLKLHLDHEQLKAEHVALQQKYDKLIAATHRAFLADPSLDGVQVIPPDNSAGVDFPVALKARG